MKVAYVFRSPQASFLLGNMIVPQLEGGKHGAEVAGMFFFEDNTYLLRAGDALGERLNKLAQKHGMLLMGCDLCCAQRYLVGKLVPNAKIGCFPDLYKALGNAGGVDQVITL